jgi:manganese/iron transport system permease protein
MEGLVEPFSHAFMQRALAEALLMGLVCGLLGCFVVLRDLAYTGESMSHTLVPGAAVAVVAGLPVLGGALLGGVAAAVVIALLLRRSDVGEDVAVGVVFSGAFAAGVILLSVRGSPRDLDSLLFGSLLAVGTEDLVIGGVAALGVTVAVLVLSRRLVLAAFDRPWAETVGARPALLDVVLVVGLALALVAALRGVGTLLVLSLLVAPAASARLLARRVGTMLAVSSALGMTAGVVGLELSYHVGVAAGPAVALTAVGLFLVVATVAAARSSARRPALST